MEALRLLAAGKRNREIAAELILSIRTVEHHLTNIYAETRVRGRTDAAIYAVPHGLVEAGTS